MVLNYFNMQSYNLMNCYRRLSIYFFNAFYARCQGLHLRTQNCPLSDASHLNIYIVMQITTHIQCLSSYEGKLGKRKMKTNRETVAARGPCVFKFLQSNNELN